MYNECGCGQCLHKTCPPESAAPPNDEISHEIDNNIITVKIPKNAGQVECDDPRVLQRKLSFDFNCADQHGKKCKTGCAKVHVIPDQYPPPKEPDESIFSFRSIREILPQDDPRSTLEVEFKGPRNYMPLPPPGPPPPIIVPKQKLRRRRRRKPRC